MDRVTRPRRVSRIRSVFAWGCALLPLTMGISLFALLFSAYAMVGPPIAFPALSEMAEEDEPTAVPSTTRDAPGPFLTPTSTAFLPEPALAEKDLGLDAGAAIVFESPSPTAQPSATSSPTITLTMTASPWPTLVPSSTTTNFYPTFTPLPSATRTQPPPPSDTPLPSATVTDGPSPTPSDTPPPPPPSETLAPTATQPPPNAGCETQLNTGFENQVAQMVNEERQSRGLHALNVQSQLLTAARIQAADMACNHFYGHTGSDGSSVRDRVRRQGYSFTWIGENFMVSGDLVNGPQIAFDWWMNSSAHRNNILGASYTEIGPGYIYGPDSDAGGYFVIVFARP